MTLSANIQKISSKVFLKGEHQAAISYLGQLAFIDLPFNELASQAASLITQVLQVEYSLLWELSADRQSLLFIAGSGGLEETVRLASVPLHSISLEKDTLSSPLPILIEYAQNESQVNFSDLLADRPLASGVSVRMGTVQKPYGVVQAFSTQGQFFSQSDIYFLQNIASLVGLALRQGNCSTELAAGQPQQAALENQDPKWDQYEIKNRLIESGERERLRLAQDLHDIPIQDLYGMIYQLDDLKDVLQDPEGIRILDECNHTLQGVINSLRTVCRELRPPSLSPFGLEVAIRDHVEKFRDQNPGITVHLALMQDKQVLSDSLRLTLFRIYQQAIHNIARHAQATDVYIRFHWDQEKVILEVEDNGTGFEVPKHWMELVREEHFGLLGIAERVESVRGKLELVSAPGAGTLLRAIIPYSRSEI